MDPHLAELEARIEGGETFAALRKAGKIELTPPAPGEGVCPLEGQYPYVAKRLTGLKGTEELRHVDVTRAGITMKAPLIESREQEERFAKTHGYRRE